MKSFFKNNIDHDKFLERIQIYKKAEIEYKLYVDKSNQKLKDSIQQIGELNLDKNTPELIKKADIYNWRPDYWEWGKQRWVEFINNSDIDASDVEEIGIDKVISIITEEGDKLYHILFKINKEILQENNPFETPEQLMIHLNNLNNHILTEGFNPEVFKIFKHDLIEIESIKKITKSLKNLDDVNIKILNSCDSIDPIILESAKENLVIYQKIANICFPDNVLISDYIYQTDPHHIYETVMLLQSYLGIGLC